MEFCKAFNAQTQKEEKNTPIPVVHHHLRGPFLHLRIADAADVLFLEAGGQDPVRLEGRRAATRAGAVTKAQVREIAEKKMKDLNTDSIESAMKMVEGSARSMGSGRLRG